MWVSFVTAACGALFGSLGGLASALLVARRADRLSTTNHLMTEFLSADFLTHRIALEGLRARMLAGEVTAAQIAGGFWYPGRRDYYKGELYGEFNTHQHLTMYIGFLERMADAIRRHRLDVATVRNGIGSHLRWSDVLLREVAAETERQAADNGAPIPTWTSAAMLAHDRLIPARPAAVSPSDG